MGVGLVDQVLGSVGTTGAPDSVGGVALDIVFSFTPVGPFIQPMLLAGKLINFGGDKKLPILGYLLDENARTNTAAGLAFGRVVESLWDDECDAAPDGKAGMAGKCGKGKTVDVGAGVASGMLACSPWCWRPVPKFYYHRHPKGLDRLRRLDERVRDAYDSKGGKGIQLALEQTVNKSGTRWLLKDFIWAKLRHDLKSGRGPQFILDILDNAGSAAAGIDLLKGTGAGKVLVAQGYLPDPADFHPTPPPEPAPRLAAPADVSLDDFEPRGDAGAGLVSVLPGDGGAQAKGNQDRPSHGAALALLAIAGLILYGAMRRG